MTYKKEFLIDGETVAEQPYHYRACGLDDVYLLNGFERTDSKFGPAVTITDVEGLHRAIAMSIISEKKTMFSALEVRFLRKEMGFTQEELAKRLGVDVQTVARYEKDQTTLPKPTAIAIALFYILSISTKEVREKIVDELRELVESERHQSETSARRDFKLTRSGWDSEAHARH